MMSSRKRDLRVPCIRSMIAALLVGVYIATPVRSLSSPPLTGPQVIQKSLTAYRHLTTYDCKTTASSPLFAGMNRSGAPIGAEILYKSPDRLRVDGIGFSGSRYAYVINGSTTEMMMFGGWSKASSPDIAIGGATGVGVHAPTLVPAILTHSTMAASMFGPKYAKNAVTTETVDGHSCYKVVVSFQYPITYWIDRRTFLLVKSYEDLSSITARATGKKEAAYVTVHFDSVAVNKPIPASTFALPKATATSPF